MLKLKLQLASLFLLCSGALWGLNAHAEFAEAERFTVISQQPSSDPGYELQLDVLIGARSETLLLKPSAVLRSNKIFDQHGNPVATPNDTRHYAGVIQNVPDSWARLSLGEDLSGTVFADGDHYDVIPVTDKRARLRQISAEQIEQVLANRGGDRLLFPPDFDSPIRHIQQALTIDTDPNHFFNQSADASKVVHIGIVVDTHYNESRAGRGLNLAIAAINSVDGIYREQMGVAISLDTTLLMTDPDTDPLRMEEQSTEEMLLEFRNYRRNTDLLGAELNLVHFFTGNPASDANIGLAFIGAACRSDGYDVSLSVPFQYPVLLAAHEIGHNLGALHDDVTSCAVDTNQVMHSQISSQTSETFSHCSLDAIAAQLTHATCLSEAIDLQVSATRLSDTSASVESHNLDLTRAVAGKQVKIELSNASITSLPASCELASTSRALCPSLALAAGETETITFEYQLLGTQEAILYAEVEPIGALDLQTTNNSVSVVLAEDSTPDGDPNMIANTDPAQNGNSSGGSAGGGGGLTPSWLLLGLVACGIRRRSQHRLN